MISGRIDEYGRMHLNGVPTNMDSGQPAGIPREIEVFHTTPYNSSGRQEIFEEDGGVIYLRSYFAKRSLICKILRVQYLAESPREQPHDFDQEILEDETPLNQWLSDGSSRRSHQTLEASLSVCTIRISQLQQT